MVLSTLKSLENRKAKNWLSPKNCLSQENLKAKNRKNHQKVGIPNFDAKNTGPSFLTPKAKLAFNRLRLAFIKAPILWYFDPKYHILIETDASGYAIGDVLSQLASETSLDGIVIKTDLGQWYPVIFFSKKIIPAETWYKTHNGELLAIVEAFKTWRHYMEGCKHEVLVLTDHKNLCCFIDTKSLSFRQVCWAQELFRWHSQIDYRQGKANAATDTLLRFPQKSQDEEDELLAKNGQIFHCLHNSLINASLAWLSLLFSFSLPSYLHKVFICGTFVLP